MAAQIPESDQIKQFNELLGTYYKLKETCFLDCVEDFTGREVIPVEEYHIQQNEALAAKARLLTNHNRKVLVDGLSVKDCQQLLHWK
ncbi:mitochondrial import inner membrane translocase subunit Tim9-like [Megaptera novaeangliae]